MTNTSRECDCDRFCGPRELERRETRRALDREMSAARDAYVAADGKVPLTMMRAAFYNIHPDFRSSPGDETHPSCLVYHRGTCLVPVTLSDGDRAPRKPRQRTAPWVEDD